ncbi:hypothetical protein K2173_009550 [Erythroxylum novogranatense]|uniref:PGG domain-containing protein n=1 Tax=Erythroxylum novogranatense TaxID=1862640 RepID=A0AAV8U7P9_9ROSI|nr:hypothetical protein K2173_009550 [Erythroxylum novogranatense]
MMEAVEPENRPETEHVGAGMEENRVTSDSSSSDEVISDSSSSNEDHTAIMDTLYWAAVEGNFDAFKDYVHCLDRLVTPTKNTILHVYITTRDLRRRKKKTDRWRLLRKIILSRLINRLLELTIGFCAMAIILPMTCIGVCIMLCFGKRDGRNRATVSRQSTDFLESVLENCPDLIWKTNIKGETPLHIAARHGHNVIILAMIDRCMKAHGDDLEKGVGAARELLAVANVNKDTALHEAVKYNQLNVVLTFTMKIFNLPYSANKAGETPLYLAAERGFDGVVKAILGSCPSPASSGPNGRTALHAAVLRNDRVITSLLLEHEEQKRALTKADDQGWIPLHYAAYYGYLPIVKQLLEANDYLAYIPTTTGQKIALHLAAVNRKIEVMKELLGQCPGCCEMVDERGWNVVHFAAASKKKKTVEFVLHNPLFRNLVNEKNNEGNPPLHQLVASGSYLKLAIDDPQVDLQAFNKSNLSFLDIIFDREGVKLDERKFARQLKYYGVSPGQRMRTDGPQRRSDSFEKVTGNRSNRVTDSDARTPNVDKTEQEHIKEARQAYMVVATLIAAVAFAAGFTMPGGYRQDGTYAVLVQFSSLAIAVSVLGCYCFYCFGIQQVTKLMEKKADFVEYETSASLPFSI